VSLARSNYQFFATPMQKLLLALVFGLLSSVAVGGAKQTPLRLRLLVRSVLLLVTRPPQPCRQT